MSFGDLVCVNSVAFALSLNVASASSTHGSGDAEMMTTASAARKRDADEQPCEGPDTRAPD